MEGLDAAAAGGIVLLMPRQRFHAIELAMLGLTVTCLTGGPVISAVHAKSCDRAQRPAKPLHQPGSQGQDRVPRSLVAPQFAKPVERQVDTPQESIGAERPTATIPTPFGPSIHSPIKQPPRVAPSPPFDALAPPAI